MQNWRPYGATYTYVNIDDGWACERDAVSGELVPCPQFPNMTKLGDDLHKQGLKFGLYTVWGRTTCASSAARPFHGSWGHEHQDAATFARWGCDYLKEDSCGGPTNGTLWERYALMRDGLNATGRSIYFSITQQFGRCEARNDGQPGCAKGAVASSGPVPAWNPTTNDGSVPLVEAVPHPSMQCFSGAFTPLPWRRQGLHPTNLANSWLVEYCNNGPRFGTTLGPGGSLLSQLDSQADWTLPELAGPGGVNDMVSSSNAPELLVLHSVSDLHSFLFFRICLRCVIRSGPSMASPTLTAGKHSFRCGRS